MDMLFILEYNMYVDTIGLTQLQFNPRKEIKVTPNLHVWMCFKFNIGVNVDLERMNIEDAKKGLECMKDDFWMLKC